jgi:hypothetical protein
VVVVAGAGDEGPVHHPYKVRRMTMPHLKHAVPLVFLGLVLFAPSCQRAPAQGIFATPEEAAAALQQAFQTEDLGKIQSIFGPEAMESVASGDSVSDRHDREVIALAMQESWRWAPRGPDARELIIGEEQWPFPVPLIKAGDGWRFDSEQGKEEVLARRIGANELNAIDICRDYVGMQHEYARYPHDGKPAGLFAQRVRSSAGREDGLYWHRKFGGKLSPLSVLVAEATAEGYDLNKPESSTFRGYHFRILTAQGPAAPGGKKSYVTNGVMKGGFALLAYPDKYAYSGVMTFMIGQDRVVYQKDFGEDTVGQALSLTEYNPDESWTAVQEP